METFLGTIVASGLAALAILAYRHPDGFRPVGKGLLFAGGAGLFGIVEFFLGVSSGLEIASHRWMVRTGGTFTWYGVSPLLVVGMLAAFDVFVAALLALPVILKPGERNSD